MDIKEKISNVEIVELACCHCGGSFSEAKAEGIVKCKFCGKVFKISDGISFLSKLEAIVNQRDKEILIRNLNKLTQEISEDFPDKDSLLLYARKVLEFDSSHAIAQLCEMLIEGNHKMLASFVQSIDKLNLDNETKLLIAKILIDNCESKFHLSISCFLENQIKPINANTFKDLFTKLEDIIEKENNETFNPRLERDVFIAHSSKDVELVSELVNALTKANRTFFLSSINLRHGFNALSEYETSLSQAMTACKIFLMINTKNSRSAYCDVYSKEIPFIKELDKSLLPPEYRYIDYKNIPTTYKKPRINYLVDNYNTELIQDQIVKDFFDGFEYRLSITDVSKSIEEQLTRQIIPSTILQPQFHQPQPIQPQPQPIEPKPQPQQIVQQPKYPNLEDSASDEVKEHYKKAITGDAKAQLHLGYCYYCGEGVKEDLKKAVYWYNLAAEQGYASAQNWLGYCYYYGKGVEKDLKKAVYWYNLAAEQGYANAQNWLGYCYYDGKGVEKDLKKAVYWYNLAAEQGFEWAQYWLGRCYEYGEGVEKDLKKAVYWYNLAAEQGNSFAKDALERIRRGK